MSVLLISRQPMKLQISFGFARAMPTTNPRTGMLWERDWHFNENPQRKHATTKAGHDQLVVIYPKAHYGEKAIARKIKEDPTCSRFPL